MYQSALVIGCMAAIVTLNPGVLRQVPLLRRIIMTERTPQPIPLPDLFRNTKEEHIHLVVLVHGIFGNPLEMGNLKESLIKRGYAAKLSGTDNEDGEGQRRTTDDTDHQFIIHSTSCNHDRTLDGIPAGGTRIAEEINEWVAATRELLDTEKHKRHISLSIVGNSLGGLYARYALSKIRWHDPQTNNPLVNPSVFVTTVTPHLGVAAPHTYAPVGRVIEGAIANALGETGRDLFRFTSVLQDITVNKEFVSPLARFRRRIAYANAYYTDFQVPGSTAAFLGESSSLHRVVESPEPASEEVSIIMSVETDAGNGATADDEGSNSSEIDLVPTESSEGTTNTATSAAPLSSDELASRLDSLGWTKHFVDLRKTLITVPNPFASAREEPKVVEEPGEPPKRQYYSSSELWRLYTQFSTDQWHVPFGHTMLLANSKDPANERANSAGKPLMYQLAGILVDQILNKEISE